MSWQIGNFDLVSARTSRTSCASDTKIGPRLADRKRQLRVAVYSPDQHLAYDVRTLDRIGVGGGVTSRIRMAHALAARGHKVTAYVNCPGEADLDGVSYRHFSRANSLQADVLIATTSGGAFDLRPLQEVSTNGALRIMMAHGVRPPRGFQPESFDYIYAPSNFIRDTLVSAWGVSATDTLVCWRGVRDSYYAPHRGKVPDRDPYAIAYAAHPSKGLEAARAVLRKLREHDLRFTLHVFGGPSLWGDPDETTASQPGLVFHGLLGQRRLARELMACGFSLNLQTRREPFGMVIPEAMRAGCIVLASPVGAYPEIIQHGRNGFLITGDPLQPRTHQTAADLMIELVGSPTKLAALRRRARATPLDWAVVAGAWEGHWEWVRRGSGPTAGVCDQCGGERISLSDGPHCTVCGRYQRPISES